MAELFKPEIGNIGGSNVTAYTPPSMDYSGIFNSLATTLNSFEKEKVTAPKLSEAEEKNLVLEPYLTKAQKILSSDDIPEVKRYALTNGIKMEVARKYPAYRETFEAALGSVTSTLDPDGDPVQKYYQDLAKWGETEVGTFSRAQAFNTAIDKEGNFDEGLYQAKLNELYAKDIKDTNSLTLQKRRNEMNVEGAKELFRTDFAPTALNDIDKSIETFTTGQGIKSLLKVVEQGGAFAAAGPEAAQSLAIADQVGQLRKWWDSELTRRKIQAGYSVNDPQFSNEPLLLELKTLEDAFRNAGTSMGTVLKSANEQFKEVVIAGLPEATKRFIAVAGSLPPGASELYAAQWITIAENRKSIEDQAKMKTVIGLDPSMPTVGTGTSTTNFIPSGSGISFENIISALPEYDPKLIEIVVSAPPAEKTEVLKKTGNFINSAKLSDENTVKVVNNNLAASYGIITTRLAGAAETGVTPLDQTKIFFGPNAMNLISEIQKKNPVLGDDLYPKVNKAIQTETVRHFAMLDSLFKNYFPNNPFILEVNDKNMVELKIDPAAKRDDPVFKRLASLGLKNDEEILKSYQETYNLNPTMVKNIKDSMESINLYLMAANKFPDSLKNSPDFAGIFIRQQLAALPKYNGVAVAIDEMGQ